MYNSLKKQQRMHGPTRRTISTRPVTSAREESAGSDPADMLALTNAMRRGAPVYLVQHVCGTTLDITPHQEVALKRATLTQSRISNLDVPVVKVFERTGPNMYRIM